MRVDRNSEAYRRGEKLGPVVGVWILAVAGGVVVSLVALGVMALYKVAL